jgi:Zn-dependent protease with chaperone function
MVTFGRVVKLIALLLGFYLLCLLLIAVLVAIDVVAFHYLGDHSSADRILGLLVFATLGAVFIVIRGVFVSTRVRRKDLPGVPVTPAQQPALWQRVRAMAETAGTRYPRDIRLVQEVNAAVFEQPHLLGLVPGKRTMLIGVPLMQALTVPQFDSVIGHELGHYSGRDSRLGPLTARVRRGVTAARDTSRQQRRGEHRIRIPGNALFEALFTVYARLVLAQTQAMSRRQELAADRLAATIGGRHNAVAALSHIHAIDAAYSFYLNRYVVAGIPAGLVPLVLTDGSHEKLARGIDEVIGMDPHTGVLREIIGRAGVPA